MESYRTTSPIFQRGKVWYLRYSAADGKRTMKRLATDKRVAEQLTRSILMNRIAFAAGGSIKKTWRTATTRPGRWPNTWGIGTPACWPEGRPRSMRI